MLWDFQTRVVAREGQPHAQAITCLAWSRNGRLVATGSRDGSAALWDVEQSTVVRPWSWPPACLSTHLHTRGTAPTVTIRLAWLQSPARRHWLRKVAALWDVKQGIGAFQFLSPAARLQAAGTSTHVAQHTVCDHLLGMVS